MFLFGYAARRYILVAISVFSQTINIRGKVTDTTGVTPIEGALVKLEKYGFTDTTDEYGIFAIGGTVSFVSDIHNFQSNKLSAAIHNGILSLYLSERSAVNITIYTLQGKAVSKIQKVMDRGTHSLAQPELSYGFYIYKIQADKSELVLRTLSIDRTGGSKFSQRES